ncbi:NAD(P)/FAD-dependent oxidoreductase [Paenarthrobacter sp. AT5]|uniref:FAD-dependent oxidoreductase n=1 Tax=Paenarthrobacter TaxID=1742992 RepID=UPI001A98972E|nr:MULTISPECIES: NAD(P)/FAD-dependent oxidoreductase [Paenarthrobacter]QSZ54319.1 FAD-binding monooxygenase [Paenarthrobacter ureafaciens]WOC59271.1 NAD(P)/FAD-dependent oxidoreductase [Paenarthrobacter sp. AT5]
MTAGPDVVVVGAGPVGLFTGLLLLQRGRSVRILERRVGRSNRSRAIGIHPPALRALDRAGIADSLVAAGVRIDRGLAYSRSKRVAELPFRSDPDFPFILAVPQPVTERTLEEAVAALDPAAVVRGARVVDATDYGGGVTVVAESPEGAVEMRARLVVAADGAHSSFRERLLPCLHSKGYPDSYLMGDFADDTGHGPAAVLYLEPDGIVESFPLPGGVRRWVVRLGSPAITPTADGLATLVGARTGVFPDESSNSMLSAFDVRARLAPRMVHGRIVLLGDAAHEISPIGGQGMNLGWLDAAAVVPLMDASMAGQDVGGRLRLVEKDRRRAAIRASRQAGLNMALGRPLPPAVMTARNAAFARALQLGPVTELVERRFTMR